MIFDNFANADPQVVHKIENICWVRPAVIQWDIRDLDQLQALFSPHKIDTVIHFAGLKSVGVSCSDPFEYYDNNIVGTMNLLRAMDVHDVKKLIFSSSATVYDATHEQAPFAEDARTGYTTNPYGTTKFVIEQLLRDMAAWKEMNIVSLRYFNPVGAHPSGLIGEDPSDIPTNLLPVLMEVVEGKREEVQIFGDDYDTQDGTCLRDYIHVVDLAKAHVAAYEALQQSSRYRVYNVGTWVWTSVQEMVELVRSSSGSPLPTKIVARRSWDVPVAVAQVHKIQQELWRKAELTVADAIEDALRFRASA